MPERTIVEQNKQLETIEQMHKDLFGTSNTANEAKTLMNQIYFSYSNIVGNYNGLDENTVLGNNKTVYQSEYEEFKANYTQFSKNLLFSALTNNMNRNLRGEKGVLSANQVADKVINYLALTNNYLEDVQDCNLPLSLDANNKYAGIMGKSLEKNTAEVRGVVDKAWLQEWKTTVYDKAPKNKIELAQQNIYNAIDPKTNKKMSIAEVARNASNKCLGLQNDYTLSNDNTVRRQKLIEMTTTLRAIEQKYASRNIFWRFFHYFGDGAKERAAIADIKGNIETAKRVGGELDTPITDADFEIKPLFGNENMDGGVNANAQDKAIQDNQRIAQESKQLDLTNQINGKGNEPVSEKVQDNAQKEVEPPQANA